RCGRRPRRGSIPGCSDAACMSAGRNRAESRFAPGARGLPHCTPVEIALLEPDVELLARQPETFGRLRFVSSTFAHDLLDRLALYPAQIRLRPVTPACRAQ